MHYPLNLTFKVLAIAPQLTIRDADGATILYVRQKMLRFKEQVEVFSDDSQQQKLFTIDADRIIDWSARYNFAYAETGQPLGAVKRRGMRSLWKVHYDLFETEETPDLSIREENPWIKVLDSVFGELPFVGALTGYVFNPTFAVLDGSGTAHFRITKRPSFLETNFKIEQLTDAQDSSTEWRVLLGLLMMVLLERRRG